MCIEGSATKHDAIVQPAPPKPLTPPPPPYPPLFVAFMSSPPPSLLQSTLQFTILLYPSSSQANLLSVSSTINPSAAAVLDPKTLEAAVALCERVQRELPNTPDFSNTPLLPSHQSVLKLLLDTSLRMLLTASKTNNTTLLTDPTPYILLSRTLASLAPLPPDPLHLSSQLTSPNITKLVTLLTAAVHDEARAEPATGILGALRHFYKPPLDPFIALLTAFSKEATVLSVPFAHHFLAHLSTLLTASLSSNPKKLFTLAATKLLTPLAALSHLDPVLAKQCTAIRNLSLFTDEHLSGFESLFLTETAKQSKQSKKSKKQEDKPPPAKKAKVMGNYQSTLFTALESLLASAPKDPAPATLALLPALLNDFILASPSPLSHFAMFEYLLNLLKPLTPQSLSTTSAMLTLLLTHSVYSPATDTPTKSHFTTLSSLNTTLLAMPPTSDTLLCLGELTELNHLITHETLSETLLRIATRIEADGEADGEADEAPAFSLLQQLSQTYTALRDLHHLFSTILAAPASTANIFTCNAFKQTLKQSIVVTPPGQIPALFDLFLDALKTTGVDDKLRSLFIVFSSNVPVSLHNARAVSRTCDTMMATAIQPLLKGGADHAPLQLASHVVELQARCIFWVEEGGGEPCEATATVATNAMLHEIIGSYESGKRSDVAFENTVTQLACNRMHQLQLELEEEEVAKITTFIFSLRNPAWFYLSKNAALWSRSGTRQHVVEFLTWLFETTAEATNSGDIETQLSLLNDTCFYEIPALREGVVGEVFAKLLKARKKEAVVVENLLRVLSQLDVEFVGDWEDLTGALATLKGNKLALRCIARGRGKTDQPLSLKKIWSDECVDEMVDIVAGERDSGVGEELVGLGKGRGKKEAFLRVAAAYLKTQKADGNEELLAVCRDRIKKDGVAAAGAVEAISELVSAGGGGHSGSGLISAFLSLPLLIRSRSQVRIGSADEFDDFAGDCLEQSSPDLDYFLAVWFSSLGARGEQSVIRWIKPYMERVARKPSNFLMAGLGQLIKDADDVDVVAAAVGCIARGIAGDDFGIGFLRCYFVILESVKGAESRALVKGIGSNCFCKALDLLEAGAGEEGGQVLEFIDVMVGKKDILLLSTREICIVLGCLSVQGRSFGAAARVVASLVKHYPKAVYIGVSVVIGVLKSMLNEVMGAEEGQMKVSGGERGSCCECRTLTRDLQEEAVLLSRLFESLINHKDVMKRHIVGLLIDFFKMGGGRGGGQGEGRELALQPGIYALFGLCTPVERAELNRLLDGGERNAFRMMYTTFSSFSFKGV